MRNLAYPVLRAAFCEIYADLARMEDLLHDSGHRHAGRHHAGRQHAGRRHLPQTVGIAY